MKCGRLAGHFFGIRRLPRRLLWGTEPIANSGSRLGGVLFLKHFFQGGIMRIAGGQSFW